MKNTTLLGHLKCFINNECPENPNDNIKIQASADEQEIGMETPTEFHGFDIDHVFAN